MVSAPLQKEQLVVQSLGATSTSRSISSATGLLRQRPVFLSRIMTSQLYVSMSCPRLVSYYAARVLMQDVVFAGVVYKLGSPDASNPPHRGKRGTRRPLGRGGGGRVLLQAGAGGRSVHVHWHWQLCVRLGYIRELLLALLPYQYHAVHTEHLQQHALATASPHL